MSKEVAEEYASSLADLTVNSKPLINMLTILAEENIDHAGVIVDTVEKHLEKVHPDIKLPVLYLVDSIIKNVGGAYTQKFSQSIVNMFTRTFKQVDEKVRSQMFKLRETWHDVFPATKLYQLDVKVNLIDPAWPIQAQPQQSNIHVNPNFLKKPVTATSSNNVTPPQPSEEDEKMRSILAKKEQELLMLQRKKVEMELEQMRRQVEMAEKTVKKVPTITVVNNLATAIPATVIPATPVVTEALGNIPVKQRLGPPVNKATGRIAPVSGALISARRDPRLARHRAGAAAGALVPATAPASAPPVAVVAPAAALAPPAPPAPIAPNVFDIKPLDRVTKRKNVITIDVRPEDAARPERDPRRREPGLAKRDPRRAQRERRREEQRRAARLEQKLDPDRGTVPAYVDNLPDPKKISKLPPIPKINRTVEKRDSEVPNPSKRKRENARAERRKRREAETPKEPEGPAVVESPDQTSSLDKRPRKEAKDGRERVPEPKGPEAEVVAFKELRNYHKERYMRRNREKSESPEAVVDPPTNVPADVVVENKDIDLRVLHPVANETKASPVSQKRPSSENIEVKAKKNKTDKFDVLFGDEDVDLRKLPQVEEINAPPPPSITSSPKSDQEEEQEAPILSPKDSPECEVNEVKKRDDKKAPSKLDLVRAKLAEATKGKEKLGRPLLLSKSPSIERETRRTFSDEDVDLQAEDQDFDKKSAPIITSQAKEYLIDGQLDKDQYDTLMYQVLQLNVHPPMWQGQQRPGMDDFGSRRFRGPRPPHFRGKFDMRTPRPPIVEPPRMPVLPLPTPKIGICQDVPADVVVENKDIDLRVLHPVANETKASPVSQKRPSSENIEAKAKKNKTDKFDVLFGNEDVDLRKLPQLEEINAPPPPSITSSPKSDKDEEQEAPILSPKGSPKNDWNEVKKRDDKKPPSKLDLVRAKLAEATKGKDRLGRPLLFSKSPSIERERRRTFSGEDVDLRGEDQDFDKNFNMKTNKKSISIIISQAKEHLNNGQLDKNQYDTLMYQIQQLNVHPPMWRGQQRPRMDDFGSRRFRGPMPPYFRGKFDKRAPRPPFVEPLRMPMPPLPTPKIGICQGECPLAPYERVESPPPLGAPSFPIPPTNFNVLEYIEQDPVKTIQIDGVPREIRFYGDTAVIMLEWDDPREIKFLPGCRRVTFDNKDSIVLTFNEDYKQVDIDDQVFDIKFGAPTRELYINGCWYECFFGGQPFGVIIDGKPRLVHLEGPMPQVDIGKIKRTDLVAGKINLIVNATQMYPIYLDAKVQKILVNGQFLTIRFVDSLRTVLINEQPFKVTFGDLPKPIFVGKEKYFIRFSALPRNVKPGYIQIANMEGVGLPLVPPPIEKVELEIPENVPMETDPEPQSGIVKSPSPENNVGLDMLASVMPSSVVEASSSEYSLAEPLFSKPDQIPGLETPSEEKPPNPLLALPININVNDLFAKLLATGIVQAPNESKPEAKENKVEEVKQKPREDKNTINRVDFLKPETLRVKQPGLVAKLYGGMQCSGCGARFPPEHTVRYSQHLDWHFRQNRRDRDSARRAHSRHWHYDLSDWLQYEEVEDLEEREKSWFETGGAEGAEGAAEAAEGGASPGAAEAPSAAASSPVAHACALCGDPFQQFYNEDKEEWHLRNAIKHERDYYHPLCFEDYKASLNKEQSPKEESSDDVTPVEKTEEEAIEIKDVDETIDDQSDNESVVEVVEEKDASEPVEIVEEDDDDDEDDVVFKADPVEEVVVDDDNDTDDETTATRAERDRQAEIDFSKIKIKQEPIDPDDEPIITAEEASIPASVDTTHATVESSIDGNLQLDAANCPANTLPIGGIRINISKSLPAFVSTSQEQDKNLLEDVSVDDEPLPPGEEPELEYKLKPSLEGVQFSRQPPVCKGNELSGLCSIM